MARKKLRSGKVPVIKKDLENGTIAEANNDGTIFLDKSVKPDSPLGREAIAHEKVHMDQMSRGDLNYDDNNVYWKGKSYPRSQMQEGAKSLPWEAEAYNKTKHMKKSKPSPNKLSFGLSSATIKGNRQTLNTFEDSPAGKVAMAGKAVAGGLENAKGKADAKKAAEAEANKNKPNASDLINSPVNMLKSTPITKKTKWWEKGAENLKKEKETAQNKEETSQKKKNTTTPKLPPPDLGIKRMAERNAEKKKRGGIKEAIKDPSGQLYEHTIGRLDTQVERDDAKDKIKRLAKSAATGVAGMLLGRKSSPATYKMKGSMYSPLKETKAVEEFRAQSGGKVGDAVRTTTGSPGETKTRKTWKQAWADNDESIKEKYESYEDYVKDRKGQQDADPDGYEKDMVDKTGVAGGPGSVTTEGNEEVETKFTPDAETKRGKYNMGYEEAMDAKWGEGVMHRDRKQNMRKYDRFSKQFDKGKAGNNPETGEAFKSAHEYAAYKLGGKDYDTKYNTQVGKRGPDSKGNVDYDPTKHGDLEEVVVGKTSTDKKVEEETENSPADMRTKPKNYRQGKFPTPSGPNPKKLTKNSSFKMKGWGGYN